MQKTMNNSRVSDEAIIGEYLRRYCILLHTWFGQKFARRTAMEHTANHCGMTVEEVAAMIDARRKR